MTQRLSSAVLILPDPVLEKENFVTVCVSVWKHRRFE